MLKCKICGYKSSSKTLMQSHISSAHRATVIRDSNLSREEECTIFSSATLASFIHSDSCSQSNDSFSGGGGSFGGGGSSDGWSDNSDSGSDSSSCDSGSCGD